MITTNKRLIASTNGAAICRGRSRPILTCSEFLEERNPAKHGGDTFDGHLAWFMRGSRHLLLVAACACVLVAHPAGAQLNGSFTNNGSGWSGTGPATNGSPSVVTNAGGITVLRIGANNGVPGAPGAKVTSTGRNVCTTTISSYCAVHFHADWTPVGNETATMRVSFKNSTGQAVVTRNITASGDHVVNGKDMCPSLVQVSFSIESGGKPVNSTLDISDVSISCDFFDWSTLAAQPTPPYGEPCVPSYPLPMGIPFGPQNTDTIVQRLGSGLSPIANPLSSGTNSLDDVLPAVDGTVLYKYNPLTGGFDSYSRDLGMWSPSNGSLGPGDAAFIDSPVPQEFDVTGQYVPFPFGQHPASGSAYFANPVTWPVLLEDVMGFKPVLGDALLTFTHGDTNSAPPGTIASFFVFQPDNFALQPAISPGETVQVFFADPSKAPLNLRPLEPGSNAPVSAPSVLLSAPGGLPGCGVLQIADSVGPTAQWKSLLGVADYYSEPRTNPARFFRLGFGLPTGSLSGGITQVNGMPASGMSVQLAPNGTSQTTDAYGRFSFFDVPLGLLDLEITAPVQVLDPVTHQVSVYPVSATLPVNLVSPVTTASITVNIAVPFVGPPACNCKPVAEAMKLSANGVTAVRLIGTSVPNPCKDDTLKVTITDPNGKQTNMGPAGSDYYPAGNGTYTVTATVCGITQTSTVTVP